MNDAGKIAETLARLTRAIASSQRAEGRADARTAAADATISDAKARIDDAEAQTAHANSHMEAAKAHMAAANAQMGDADARIIYAVDDQELADEQMADAVAMIADENEDSAEYQRALYHYRQLIRHRLANPLQIIHGMAHTMLHQDGICAQQRREMLILIEEQAILMERLSIFAPEVQTDAERELSPRPFQ